MTRSPKTIRQVLSRIETLWIKNKELRLGQLLVNAAQTAGRDSDIFYIDDDDLVTYVNLYDSKVEAMREDGSSELAERQKSSRKGKTTREEASQEDGS